MSNTGENRKLRRSQAYQDYVDSLPREAKEVPPEIRTLVFKASRVNQPLPIIEEIRKLIIANYSAQDRIARDNHDLMEVVGLHNWRVIQTGNDVY